MSSVTASRVLNVPITGSQGSRLPSSLANHHYVGMAQIDTMEYRIYATIHSMDRLRLYEYDTDTILEAVMAMGGSIQSYRMQSEVLVRLHEWDVSFVFGFNGYGNVYVITVIPRGAEAYPATRNTIVIDA